MKRLAGRFPASRLAHAAAAGGVLVSYPVLLLAALLPAGRSGRIAECWVFLAATAVSYVAEAMLPLAAKHLLDTLNWLQVGVVLRWAFREIALAVLLARVLGPGSAEYAGFVGGLVALHLVRAIYAALVIRINQWRRLPVVTRNLDLGKLRIPDPPPQWLIADYVRKGLYADALPVAGGVVSALTGSFAWGLGAVALALAASAGLCAFMALHTRRNRHLADGGRAIALAHAQVREYQPEVMLYFSGARDSLYQANMWLATLAALRRPAVIVMRERKLVPLLGPTSLPVVCLDGMVELINFSLPSVRVVLYPANTAKNLHELRVPGIGHVFVGHGDSDKTASFNPFSKVYDEVWVAGPGGRDRYLRAQVGVRDEDIVEVGRPQLAGLRTAADQPADRVLTVLYAPTWEGWVDDQCQTSIIVMGARIIRALLACEPRLRVLYKPHPLTGTRDSKAAAAHEAIVSLIEQANRQHDTGRAAGEAGPAAHAAAAEVSRLAARISELTGAPDTDGREPRPQPGTDEATLSRDSKPDPAADAELLALKQAWHTAYWTSQAPGHHRVISDPLVDLYECFNQADLLISDISSVVADFIATGKPYLVANPEDLDEDVFRDKFPTAGAGYLLGRDCAGLPGIIAQAADPAADPLAQARRELKSYLLGPDSPDAITRFNDAVDRLAARVSGAGAPEVTPAEASLAAPADAELAVAQVQPAAGEFRLP